MHRTYAGIGSRKTPVEFKPLIKRISSFLEREGYMLNSGGADGADSFFEEGIKINKYFYLAKDLMEMILCCIVYQRKHMK